MAARRVQQHKNYALERYKHVHYKCYNELTLQKIPVRLCCGSHGPRFLLEMAHRKSGWNKRVCVTFQYMYLNSSNDYLKWNYFILCRRFEVINQTQHCKPKRKQNSARQIIFRQLNENPTWLFRANERTSIKFTIQFPVTKFNGQVFWRPNAIYQG